MAGFVFTISGNIGAGKATVMEALRVILRGRGIFVFEPVEKWKPLLDGIYEPNQTNEERMRAVGQFQVEVIHHFMEWERNIPVIRDCHEHQPIFVERGMQDVWSVFLPANRSVLGLANIGAFYKLLKLVRDEKEHGTSRQTVYLRVSPETCMTRVEKRGRESETSGGLSMDYLQRLHELHEETYAVDGSFPADLILDAESRSPQELAEELVDFYSLR